jgi:hypothetical protein
MWNELTSVPAPNTAPAKTGPSSMACRQTGCGWDAGDATGVLSSCVVNVTSCDETWGPQPAHGSAGGAGPYARR